MTYFNDCEKLKAEHKDLVNRLRGIYTIPVNDGAGLLNGKDTFTRDFSNFIPPIHKEAATAIEDLKEKLEIATVALQKVIAYGNAGKSVPSVDSHVSAVAREALEAINSTGEQK